MVTQFALGYDKFEHHLFFNQQKILIANYDSIFLKRKISQYSHAYYLRDIESVSYRIHPALAPAAINIS